MLSSTKDFNTRLTLHEKGFPNKSSQCFQRLANELKSGDLNKLRIEKIVSSVEEVYHELLQDQIKATLLELRATTGIELKQKN